MQESAGKMAKALYSRIMKDDPYAARLVSGTYATPRTGRLS